MTQAPHSNGEKEATMLLAFVLQQRGGYQHVDGLVCVDTLRHSEVQAFMMFFDSINTVQANIGAAVRSSHANNSGDVIQLQHVLQQFETAVVERGIVRRYEPTSLNALMTAFESFRNRRTLGNGDAPPSLWRPVGFRDTHDDTYYQNRTIVCRLYDVDEAGARERYLKARSEECAQVVLQKLTAMIDRPGPAKPLQQLQRVREAVMLLIGASDGFCSEYNKRNWHGGRREVDLGCDAIMCHFWPTVLITLDTLDLGALEDLVAQTRIASDPAFTTVRQHFDDVYLGYLCVCGGDSVAGFMSSRGGVSSEAQKVGMLRTMSPDDWRLCQQRARLSDAHCYWDVAGRVAIGPYVTAGELMRIFSTIYMSTGRDNDHERSHGVHRRRHRRSGLVIGDDDGVHSMQLSGRRTDERPCYFAIEPVGGRCAVLRVTVAPQDATALVAAYTWECPEGHSNEYRMLDRQIIDDGEQLRAFLHDFSPSASDAIRLVDLSMEL